jgi:hypothetical protein
MEPSPFQPGGIAHDFVFVDRITGQFSGDLAFPHDHNTVANSDDFRHLRGDHHDRHAFGGQRGDEVIDLLLGADIDAASRFVDDNDLRIGIP